MGKKAIQFHHILTSIFLHLLSNGLVLVVGLAADELVVGLAADGLVLELSNDGLVLGLVFVLELAYAQSHPLLQSHCQTLNLLKYLYIIIKSFSLFQNQNQKGIYSP